MASKELFSGIVGLLQIHFGKQSDETIGSLFNILKDIPDDDLKKGCSRLVKIFRPTSACGFPVPSDFFEACGLGSERKAKDLMDLLSEAVHSIGIYKSVDFGNPAMHSAISRFGGWKAICNWTQDEWNINEGRFLVVLKSAIEYGDKGPDHLSGIFEETNGAIRNDLKYVMRKDDGGIRIGVGPHPNRRELKIENNAANKECFDIIKNLSDKTKM
jgi:hypothetical protein